MPGFSAYFWDGTDTSDLMLPVVLTSAQSSHKLMNYVVMYENVTVRITSNGTIQGEVDPMTKKLIFFYPLIDTNAFKEMLFDTPTILAYSIVYPILSGSCLGFAIYKQIMFIKYKKLQHSIAQTVLWLEIVGNTRK